METPNTSATATAGTETAKADIKPGAVSDLEASGAIAENDAKARVDLDHPAVDNNPRERMPVNSNRIDLNDPTLSGREAVERALKDQTED